MSNPLPNLRARNLGRGGIFHQIKDRHRTAAAQPRFQISHPDADVRAQPLFGDRFGWAEIEQIRGGNLNLLAFFVIWFGCGILALKTSSAS